MTVELGKLATRWTFAALSIALLLASAAIGLIYKRDLRAAREATVRGSVIVITAAGPIEYAEKGDGYPVLLIHGAGGGFDQGLTIANELIGPGNRVVAPSRFGYLRTPVPTDASVAAQADAHAALLDRLKIKQAVIIGISAGARSAVELALRHPGGVTALILIVPGTYSPTSPVSISAGRGNDFAFWTVNNGGDFAWWLAEKIVPSILIRFIGVRPDLVRAAPPAARNRVINMVETIEPLSLRFAGIVVDSNAVLHELPLSTINVPTLVISARDDLFNTLPAAQYAASRIPRAELIVYEDGGHLLVGHEQNVRMRIRRFISAATSNSQH